MVFNEGRQAKLALTKEVSAILHKDNIRMPWLGKCGFYCRADFNTVATIFSV